MPSQILINEVSPNPETGNEWIEFIIKDETDQSPDVKNYTIFDSYHQIYKFNDEQFTEQLLVVEVSGLNNDRDSVILKDSEGNVLDSFSYTQTQKGFSWSKNTNNNFAITEPSRNQINPDNIIVEEDPKPSITLEPVSISPTPSPSQPLSPTPTNVIVSEPIINIFPSYHVYDLSKIKLMSEQKNFKERQTQLVFLEKNEEQSKILNAIIGSSLIILSSLFLIYVKVKNRHH